MEKINTFTFTFFNFYLLPLFYPGTGIYMCGSGSTKILKTDPIQIRIHSSTALQGLTSRSGRLSWTGRRSSCRSGTRRARRGSGPSPPPTTGAPWASCSYTTSDDQAITYRYHLLQGRRGHHARIRHQAITYHFLKAKAKAKGIVLRDLIGLQTILMDKTWVPGIPLKVYFLCLHVVFKFKFFSRIKQTHFLHHPLKSFAVLKNLVKELFKLFSFFITDLCTVQTFILLRQLSHRIKLLLNTYF